MFNMIPGCCLQKQIKPEISSTINCVLYAMDMLSGGLQHCQMHLAANQQNEHQEGCQSFDGPPMDLVRYLDCIKNDQKRECLSKLLTQSFLTNFPGFGSL